jgi:hypothetical protein
MLIFAANQAAPSWANMAQQFQVPQFIEREARLIGPLTIKQTAFLVIGGVILFLLWFMLAKWLFFILAPFLSLFFFLLSFLRINGRPLVEFLFSFFSFFLSAQVFIWQKIEHREKALEKKGRVLEKYARPGTDVTSVTKQEIKELAKKLDQ